METVEDFMKDPSSHAEFIYGITDHVIQMGLESHARMTEEAESKMLEEAVDSSYEKGGQCASITAYENMGMGSYIKNTISKKQS